VNPPTPRGAVRKRVFSARTVHTAKARLALPPFPPEKRLSDRAGRPRAAQAHLPSTHPHLPGTGWRHTARHPCVGNQRGVTSDWRCYYRNKCTRRGEVVGGFGRTTLMVAGGGGSVWPAGGTGRSRLPPPDTRRRRVGGAGALNPLALLPAGEEQLEFAKAFFGFYGLEIRNNS
jgi:hypothetical protein